LRQEKNTQANMLNWYPIE